MEGGAAGQAQAVGNQLIDAAQAAANTGAEIVQDTANAGADAIRGEAGTLLKAVGETMGHLQTLFENLSKAIVGE